MGHSTHGAGVDNSSTVSGMFISLPLSPCKMKLFPFTVVLIIYAVGEAPQHEAGYRAAPRDEQPDESM
jgi:hypothetical protein